MKRLFSPMLLGLLLVLCFSCRKEQGLLTSKTSTDPIQANVLGVTSNSFLQHFDQQQQAFEQTAVLPLVHPLRYDLDPNTAYIPEYFGPNSRIFRYQETPFELTDWLRLQALMIHLPSGEYQTKSLLYVADSAFYQTESMAPSMLNFTGKVLEYSAANELDQIYVFEWGEVIHIEDFQGRQKPKCPKWGASWLERIWKWISGINIHVGNGGGSGSGTGGGGSWGSPGWGGGWGDHSGGSDNGGGPTNGGGGSQEIEACRQANFWSTIDPQVKKDYIRLTSQIVNNHGAQACDNPYITNIQDCFDQEDLLCFAFNQGCFDGYTLPSAGEFTDCMIEYFYQSENEGNNDGNACADYAEAFIEQYGLPWSAFDLAVLVGGFEGHCGSAEEFEGFVMGGLEELADIAMVIVEGDSVREVSTGILPYSCRSFRLSEVAPNIYETTITWWEPKFMDISLIPGRTKIYPFRISIDLKVTALPGEPLCEVKNLIAKAFNDAVISVVDYIGYSRLYRSPRAEDEIEEIITLDLSHELQKHFPLTELYTGAKSPSSAPLAGFSLIPAIPGEAYNCCD